MAAWGTMVGRGTARGAPQSDVSRFGADFGILFRELFEERGLKIRVFVGACFVSSYSDACA